MNIKFEDITLREKIGQTVVVQSPMIINMESRGEMEKFLKDNPVGLWHTCNTGIFCANLQFLESGDDPKDGEFYRAWTERYKKCLRLPPFIALDPPSKSYASDFPTMPSAACIGAAGDDELAYKSGEYMALMTKALGANWVWGTVVDMFSRFSAGHIGRTMSSDLDILTRLAAKQIAGGQSRGVVMTAKHFPGSDSTEYRDSHFCGTTNRDTKEVWNHTQGEAFRRMINSGVKSVMIGHTGFPAYDNRRVGRGFVPSTVSYNVITKLLKEEMGFDGVVVTDAVDMASLKVMYPDKEDLYSALLMAGVDVVLGADLDYVDVVESALKKGKVTIERIDDACRRILTVKEAMGLFEDDVPTMMTTDLRKEICDYSTVVAERGMCLQCDDQGLIPLNKEKIKNVAIICFSHSNQFLDNLQIMKGEFEKRGAKVRLQRRVASYEEMREIAEENDLIVYPAYVAPHTPMGGSGLFCEECEALFFALTAGREKSIGVSMYSPYVYYDYFIGMDTYVHTFSKTPESQIAFVKAIYGEIPFRGEYCFEKPWEEDV